MWINDFCLLPQLINCSSITIFNNTLYVIGDLTLLEDFYLKVYAFDLKSGVEWKCLDSTKIKRLNPGQCYYLKINVKYNVVRRIYIFLV